MTASRSFVRFAAFFLLHLTTLSAQTLPSANLQKLLPPDAKVIETANLKLGPGKSRALILWMRHPERVVRQDAGYCGDDVYGDYWLGPTRLSLVDLAKSTLVNTVEVHPSYEHPDDRFQIPFFVSNSLYYVPRPNVKKEGQPAILKLQDLTGEGVLGQFVLFDFAACGIVSTSVFGYNLRSERVVQYPIEIVAGNEKPRTVVWVWQIFSRKPIRPGYWDFTWGPGHGAEELIHEQVSFDRERQLFLDKQEITPYPVPPK